MNCEGTKTLDAAQYGRVRRGEASVIRHSTLISISPWQACVPWRTAAVFHKLQIGAAAWLTCRNVPGMLACAWRASGRTDGPLNLRASNWMALQMAQA